MEDEKIKCTADEMKPSEITLDFPSVGATENIMLASIFIEGTTKIKNPAMEPEIEDLQNMLNTMGANIKGAGSSTIEITGVKCLKNVIYTVMPDRIEAGTMLCAVTATGRRYKIKKCRTKTYGKNIK